MIKLCAKRKTKRKVSKRSALREPNQWQTLLREFAVASRFLVSSQVPLALHDINSIHTKNPTPLLSRNGFLTPSLASS